MIGTFCQSRQSISSISAVLSTNKASGQTLYIEPESVVSKNNQLRESQIAERQEERRILLKLSNLLRPYQEDIQNNATILGHLDFVNAKARYAHDLKATEPILSPENQIALRQARHPLIDPKRVVANDIALGKDYKAISCHWTKHWWENHYA